MSIAIVQPNFASGNVGKQAANYWHDVDTDPNYVVLVEVQGDDGWDTGGIFSDRATAFAWAQRQDVSCVIAAKRIDCPEWGNSQEH